MTFVRNKTILASASLILLALFASSMAVCAVAAETDCCADERDCNDGAICHCACAYTGILPEVSAITLIPILAGKLTTHRSSASVSAFSRDFFRPPRLS
jgi:hypothetical protein